MWPLVPTCTVSLAGLLGDWSLAVGTQRISEISDSQAVVEFLGIMDSLGRIKSRLFRTVLKIKIKVEAEIAQSLQVRRWMTGILQIEADRLVIRVNIFQFFKQLRQTRNGNVRSCVSVSSCHSFGSASVGRANSDINQRSLDICQLKRFTQ